MSKRNRFTVVGGLMLLAVPHASAITLTHFDEFTPLTSSAGPIPVGSAGEATPLTLGNSSWKQTSIADRNTQLAAGQFNSGAWDMITLNETGVDKGRYLFTVFETGQAGIQRHDLKTGVIQTIYQSPAAAPALNSAVAFDAAYWTPWGTFITAEESWGTQPQPYGRLFEVTNPLAPVGSVNTVIRNNVPRVSHEGIQFDAAGNMYFIDELNGGSIYKYTSVAGVGTSFFDAGQTSVLRVGTGAVDNATGASTWVPFTDANGVGLAGSITIIDPNGVSAVDGRATTNLAAFLGTNYQRPEDLQIKKLANGDEILYVATTTTNEVYAINLTTGNVVVAVNRNTIDEATGLAVGSALTSPDNLAIDSEGNIYIIEDRNGGVDDDVWFLRDLNGDGIAESIARWATVGTQGAELSGLYFSPFDPNIAYINVQHPTSGNDRMILIDASGIPEPATMSLLGLAGMVLVRRNRRIA